MDLDKIIKKFRAIKSDPFRTSNPINSFPHGTKRFKGQLIQLIEAKIREKDPKDLEILLAIAYWDGLDESYTPVFKELILITWHDYHEDLVDCIRELKDDAFTDDLYTIAITPDPYRRYDDELEATLRKCVHALKEINSERANERLEQLKATGNENIFFVLDMYH